MFVLGLRIEVINLERGYGGVLIVHIMVQDIAFDDIVNREGCDLQSACATDRERAPQWSCDATSLEIQIARPASDL